ncbi:hypothetical protein SAMN02910298_01028 [Pseudobutyrivibrio sp. YE44]|uniref:hypothetical protein n=1 Tax=Pseudobutyrivibrio sp. YE44 TaxID=1520802 RepID=UPI00087ED2D1|nr:hypothetical protein [Pseudobutyrivibrio sp. YE44]SDB21510.1 hypothetical protein SAMN02910298_01028 [Pseudobutyrivibrio sp. YE44]
MKKRLIAFACVAMAVMATVTGCGDKSKKALDKKAIQAEAAVENDIVDDSGLKLTKCTVGDDTYEITFNMPEGAEEIKKIKGEELTQYTYKKEDVATISIDIDKDEPNPITPYTPDGLEVRIKDVVKDNLKDLKVEACTNSGISGAKASYGFLNHFSDRCLEIYSLEDGETNILITVTYLTPEPSYKFDFSIKK